MPSAPTAPLLRPLELGRTTMPNRIVFGAHLTNFGRGNGFTERHRAYYRERAAGGAGLIVTEALTVHSLDWPYEHVPFGHSDAILPSLAALAQAVRAANPRTRLLAQLNHTGGQCSGRLLRQSPWAPSPIADVASKRVAREMRAEEIAQVIAGFAAAAGRVARAGLDGVELNAGQWSLLRQFLSPLSNFRQDAYGGDPERRLRFLSEVAGAVRAALGPEPVLGVKLCGDELAPWGGLTVQDAATIAQRLVTAGGVDYLSIEIGGPYSTHLTDAAMPIPQGHGAHLAEAVRRALRTAGLGVPVFAEGRIETVPVAEEILAQGRADAVVMTRALISDPRLPRKVARAQGGGGCAGGAGGAAVNAAPGADAAAARPTVGGAAAGAIAEAGIAAGPGAAAEAGTTVEAVADAEDGEPIRPHIGHLRYFSVRGDWNRPVGDLANPRAGREASLPALGPLPEARPPAVGLSAAGLLLGTGRPVLVVGGGPAGCEAALTLARQGWAVTLLEARGQVGGWAARLAETVPARAEFGLLAAYQRTMLARLGVTVRLNRRLRCDEAEVDGRPLEEYARIYLAVGAAPPAATLSLENPGCPVWTARALLDDPPPQLPAQLPSQRRAAVVDAEYGFRMGNAVEWLLARGFAVDVVSPDLFVGRELVESGEFLWFQRVATAKRGAAAAATLRPRMQARMLRGRDLVCADRFSGQETVLGPLALVVLAQPEVPATGLYEALAARRPVVRIGDARAPRQMGEAIVNAYRTVLLGAES